MTVDEHSKTIEKNETKTAADIRRISLIPILRETLLEYIECGKCTNDYFFLLKKWHFNESIEKL